MKNGNPNETWASDHWPTKDEWDRVMTQLVTGADEVEEMALRLRATIRGEGTAPAPTFEDLGLHATYANHLSNEMLSLSRFVKEIEQALNGIDDVRLEREGVRA